MAKDVTCTINGKLVSVPTGTTIINAAKKLGITITSFCYQPDLRAWGSCQMCIVNVLGKRGGTIISCATPVRDGMEVATHDEVSYKARQDLLKLFLVDHALDCPTCDASGECQLQDSTYEYGVAENPFHRPKRVREVQHFSDLIDFKHDRCVTCSQCIRTCEEVIGASAITMANRGYESTIIPAFGNSLYDTDCTHCGMCVQVCPVGALTDRQYGEHPWEMQTTRSICGFCPVGCSLDVQTREGDLKRIQGSAIEYGVNRGYTCVKGRWSRDYMQDGDRLEMPLIREGDALREATWEEALTLIAGKLAAHRDGSFAALAAPTLTNEDLFSVASFTRQVMNSRNVDVAGRAVHAAGDRAMIRALGTAAVTNSKSEMLDARMFLLVGTNMPETHPVLSYDIHIPVRTRDAKLVIISPTWNNLCEVAGVWLQIRPGTETAALLAMANVAVSENLLVASFLDSRVEGLDAWKTSVAEMTPERAAEICGVPAKEIVRAAQMYAKGGYIRNKVADTGFYPPSMAFFGAELTAQPGGEDATAALLNLALVTGNIGRAGAGVWPLRDGANHQGAYDMDCVPTGDGVAEDAMLPAAGTRIRAMLISGDNPAGDVDSVLAYKNAAALRKLDFLVVHDTFLTETARLADVVLPATTWTEMSGTMTNVDRHVQLLRPAIQPIGESRPLWDAINDLAGLMGEQSNYTAAAEIFDAITMMVPAYAGLSHQRLDWDNGMQWPVPDADATGTPILFTDTFGTANGKAQLTAVAQQQMTAPVGETTYGLVLTTTRGPEAHRTATQMRPAITLSNVTPTSDLIMNPADALRRKIVTGDRVRIISQYGATEATVLVSDQSHPGLVYLEFDVDAVTPAQPVVPTLDAAYRIGELKVCAVDVQSVTSVRPEMVAAGGD